MPLAASPLRRPADPSCRPRRWNTRSPGACAGRTAGRTACRSTPEGSLIRSAMNRSRGLPEARSTTQPRMSVLYPYTYASPGCATKGSVASRSIDSQMPFVLVREVPAESGSRSEAPSFVERRHGAVRAVPDACFMREQITDIDLPPRRHRRDPPASVLLAITVDFAKPRE